MNTTSRNSRSTSEYQEIDRRHHWHPFTDTKELNETGVRVITRADGVYLWDSEDNRLIDGMAGLWCVNIGYGRSELRDVAAAQLDELPYYNTFFNTATPPAIELGALLGEVTPDGFSHVFFANSGSEANDTIAKMVRFYWNLRGKPAKKTIVSRQHAYHGVTMAAASLSGMSAMQNPFDLPLDGFAHIDAPYWYQEGGEASPDEFGVHAARALERLIADRGASMTSLVWA